MATDAIRIDRSKRLSEEPRTGHNRWHPDIPPVVRVDPGDTVVMETRDALDGAITPGTTVADLHRVDLDLVHPLTGPVFVNGAEPGDLLEVYIVDITPNRLGSRRSSQALAFYGTISPRRFWSNGPLTEPLLSLPISLVCGSLLGRLWASWAWHLPGPRGRAWRRVRMNCCAAVALSCHRWRRGQCQRQNP